MKLSHGDNFTENFVRNFNGNFYKLSDISLFQDVFFRFTWYVYVHRLACLVFLTFLVSVCVSNLLYLSLVKIYFKLNR